MPLFEVKKLSAGYDQPLLKDIDLTAHAGETIGLLGRNGCGKSTLLRGIAGVIHRYGGEIWIAGQNCTAMTARQQAKCLSLLPQQLDLIDGITARDLIAMGRYPHSNPLWRANTADDESILRSAESLGVSPLLDRDCAQLSQGQRQLVFLARTLAQDAPVMLLDEPNAALDFDNTHVMFRALKNVIRQQQKAALIVLHDPELAMQYCDRILLMKDGVIAASLTPSLAGSHTLEEQLRLIYPRITVQQDSVSHRFRCDIQSEIMEE